MNKMFFPTWAILCFYGSLQVELLGYFAVQSLAALCNCLLLNWVLSNDNDGFCKIFQCPESWTNVFAKDLPTVWSLLVLLVIPISESLLFCFTVWGRKEKGEKKISEIFILKFWSFLRFSWAVPVCTSPKSGPGGLKFFCHPQTTKLASHWYNICLDLPGSCSFIKLASV